MDNWYKYLKARDDVTDFYQVVWQQSLRKTIKELAEKIKEYDANIYEKLGNSKFVVCPRGMGIDTYRFFIWLTKMGFYNIYYINYSILSRY